MLRLPLWNENENPGDIAGATVNRPRERDSDDLEWKSDERSPPLVEEKATLLTMTPADLQGWNQ